MVEITAPQPPEQLRQTLVDYFQARAYRLGEPPEDVTTPTDWTHVVGTVRPSLFLAVFLSGLSAVGLLCFGLVLATVFESYGAIFFGLVLLAPLTAVIYWKKAKREERVAFRVLPDDSGSALTVRAHRDEIIQLRSNVDFTTP